MLNAEEAKEILRSIAALPMEKVAEVRDFVSFRRPAVVISTAAYHSARPE